MTDDTALQRCLNVAYRYLAYCPRSEAEVKRQLHRRGFDDRAIGKAVTEMKKQNLIDDFVFAQFWKDSRLSHNPKSRRLIEKELGNKKVAKEIVDRVTRNIDDEANAYRLGYKRVHALAHLDYPDFYRRLSNYLSYRGFTYEIIRRTAIRLWQEKEGKASLWTD